MAITKVINDAVDLNQTSDYSGLRLPVGTTGDVIESFTADYLVVGGGGGTGTDSPGGGGGGGLRTSYNNSTTTTNTLSFPSGKTAIATYMLDNNATDISGNYNGTESYITYNTGKYGGGAVFNGSSSYINTNYTLTGSTTFTWSAWINTSNTKNTYVAGDFNSAGANAAHRFSVRIYSQVLQASVNNSAGGLGTTISFGTFAHYGSWAHLVVTIDGTTVRGYVNGSQLGSTGTSSQSLAAGANPLTLGMYGSGGAGVTPFDGLIDQVRIYNSALSATDVSNIYTNEVQAPSGGGTPAESSVTLLAGTSYGITVGDGGTKAAGSNSVFSNIISDGGGAGGGSGSSAGYNGGNGGSGGGASGGNYSLPGGNGTTAQGYAGGGSGSQAGAGYPGGGGGGASAKGQTLATSSDNGGTGGDGVITNILNSTNATSASVGEVSGSNVYYSGGGGGSTYTTTLGTGGLGGGADGQKYIDAQTTNNGTANTGGGGGAQNSTGGSGVVILRYPTASVASFTVTGTLNTPSVGAQTQFTEGSDTVIVFTGGTGTVTFSGTNPAPPQGALRTNTSYSEDGSGSAIEHYNGSAWKYFDAVKYCTTNTLNFPSGAGCVASYNLNNNVDDIGNTYNGLNSNVTFTASGKFGAAAVFNGSSSGISIPSVNLGTSFTISVWFNWDGQDNNQNATIVGSNDENPSIIHNKFSTSNSISYDYSGGSVVLLSSVTANQWYNIVIVHSGTSFEGFVNGVSVGTNTVSNITATIEGIGYDSNQSRFLSGKIDQVRMFNSALTSSQVGDLYNNEIACS